MGRQDAAVHSSLSHVPALSHITLLCSAAASKFLPELHCRCRSVSLEDASLTL